MVCGKGTLVCCYQGGECNPTSYHWVVMEVMGEGVCFKSESRKDRQGSMEHPFCTVSGKVFVSRLWENGWVRGVLRLKHQRGCDSQGSSARVAHYSDPCQAQRCQNPLTKNVLVGLPVQCRTVRRCKMSHLQLGILFLTEHPLTGHFCHTFTSAAASWFESKVKGCRSLISTYWVLLTQWWHRAGRELSVINYFISACGGKIFHVTVVSGSKLWWYHAFSIFFVCLFFSVFSF